MTRRDWWIGITLLVVALLMHAAFPRYEWRQGHQAQMLRIDRWTGRIEQGGFYDARGWVSVAQRQAEEAARVDELARRHGGTPTK